MLQEIELWTADVEFVAVVDILPFPASSMPEVVGWGDRVFKRGCRPAKGERWRYYEAFAVVSLTPSPGRPREAPPVTAREVPQPQPPKGAGDADCG